MKTVLNSKKYKYCTIEKPFLTNCTTAVKNEKIQGILENEVLASCVLNSGFKVDPIFSRLNNGYSGLIGNTVALTTEIMGHLFRFGTYKGNFEKEMFGIDKCKDKLDEKYKEKFNIYSSKVLEFKDNRNIITEKDIAKIFEYVLEMSIFEKIYRGDDPNKLFSMNNETYNNIIEEVKSISRYTFKCLLKQKESQVKDSFFSNPVFSTKFSGIMADGGFIINNDLYNIKTTKKSEPYKTDIYQMLMYYLLSRSKKIMKELNNIEFIASDNIENLYIYNSRHTHTYKINIKQLTDEQVDDIMFRIYEIIREPYKNIQFSCI